jgi:hypothetical protein
MAGHHVGRPDDRLSSVAGRSGHFLGGSVLTRTETGARGSALELVALRDPVVLAEVAEPKAGDRSKMRRRTRPTPRES